MRAQLEAEWVDLLNEEDPKELLTRQHQIASQMAVLEMAAGVLDKIDAEAQSDDD